jgi:hypothetical protein
MTTLMGSGYTRLSPMPVRPVAKLKAALTRERRTNRRLRALITQMQDELAKTRGDVDLQFKRLAQLQAEVDLLKPKA